MVRKAGKASRYGPKVRTAVKASGHRPKAGKARKIARKAGNARRILKKAVKKAVGPSRPAFRRKDLLLNSMLRDFLINTAGENASRILGEMTSAVSDEELARTCKLKVSEVRAVLNKLHIHGIADYERTRDKDTGWYYYKWYANERAMMGLIEGEKRKKSSWERQQALEATYSFYSCSSHENEKHSFEVALDYLFKCPQCGNALNYIEGSQLQKK